MESIKQIIEKVLYFSRKNNLKTINMPLLGTGAGGLSPTAVYNCIKESVEGISLTFNVFAFGTTVYNEIISL